MTTILLRNTVSGVTSPFEETYARRLLADPHFGKINVEVKSEKPEVLSEPYEVEDGERKPLPKAPTKKEEV